MKINKILIVSVIALMIILNNNLFSGEADIHDYTGERIHYLISPLGILEYNNLGVVDLKGIKANLITLRTKALLIDNTDKIYSDPESLLPYKIERDISRFWGKEYITEEYNQKEFTVAIRKFKGVKLIKEQIIKADGPIQNVILFLFYLRGNPDLKIGWHFTAQVPDEFKSELVSIKLELVSIDQITVPAGKFQAYHFKCMPAKFEIWVNKDTPQIPLKIKSKGLINYALTMKKYSLDNN